jgi:hypothetical protein
MFVVTVLSVDNEKTSKVFGAMSDARRWASSAALNEFDGDVAAVMIYQTVADNPRQALEEVSSGGGRFVEGKAHPMTAEQAERLKKADAHRFLAQLGFTDWDLHRKRQSKRRTNRCRSRGRCKFRLF